MKSPNWTGLSSPERAFAARQVQHRFIHSTRRTFPPPGPVLFSRCCGRCPRTSPAAVRNRHVPLFRHATGASTTRSDERRDGKECVSPRRSILPHYHDKKKKRII